jgi:hypothetical protein
VNNGKYTEEIAQKIAELVTLGTPAKYAAIACGISEPTFYRWLDEYDSFKNRIQQMRGQAIADRIATLKKASEDPKHWTAAAWWLERQEPEEFALKQPPKNISLTVEVKDCTQPKCIEAEIVDALPALLPEVIEDE